MLKAAQGAPFARQRIALYGLCAIVACLIFFLQREARLERADLEVRNLPSLELVEQTVPNELPRVAKF